MFASLRCSNVKFFARAKGVGWLKRLAPFPFPNLKKVTSEYHFRRVWMWQMQWELFYTVKVLLSRCCLRKCFKPVMINHNQLNFMSHFPSPSKLVSLSLYVDFYARSILWRKMFFWLVTRVGQRKNSESPWGIKPQTFGFHNLMLFH